MIRGRSADNAAARGAMLCAAALAAQQVGLKSARDALFLSSFGVSALPTMVMGSALLSIGFVLLASRVMAAATPARVVPAGFGASSLLLFGIGWAAPTTPRGAAVALYLHAGCLGSVLISGFWLLVSERFDPRAGKARIGHIAGAGTVGGLLGGIVAERVAALAGVAALIPVLGLLHLVCAGTVGALTRAGGDPEPASDPARSEDVPALPRLLARDAYLRAIAAFVLLASVCATLADYLFKARAAAAFADAAQLARFFAAFYTGAGLLALTVQVGLGRRILERFGLARTAGTLPLAVAAGAVSTLVAPGLASAGGLRAAESVLRGSLYRLGYELLYAPLAAGRRRAAKGFVDVAVDRAGDVVGAGIVRGALLAIPGAALSALAGLTVAFGLLGIWLVRSVQRGYLAVLEEGLRSRIGSATVPLPGLGAVDAMDTGFLLLSAAPRSGAEPGVPLPEALDPVVAQVADLRSGDASRVRRALNAAGPHDPLLAPHLIQLLAWDEVSRDAARALGAIAPAITGALVDALLDPEQEFAIRRRVPRALAECASRRAVDGLLAGLSDRRFEVRFACARALARVRDRDPGLVPAAGLVFAQVVREAAVGKSLWDSRVLVERDDGEGPALADELLRDRCDRSLEHVFTLLSLALPRDPLRIAFRALHTREASLRGLALEYLEGVLPAEVRGVLIPLLEPEGRAPAPPRPREQVLEELRRSHSSIELNLAGLRPGAQASTAR